MAINTSLAPLPANRFGFLQAQHLLSRAGFGGTPTQIATLQNMGLAAAVDLLVDYDSIRTDQLPAPEYDTEIIRSLTLEERLQIAEARKAGNREFLDRLQAQRQAREAEDRQQMARLEHWWLARMIQTPRPLEEKLTLLWHGHFASNHRTVEDSYLMLRQNQFFRQNACGNVARLVGGIIRDPAMIKFLNNDSNRKAHPNENLARELMELFTLGEGNYSEQDIKEGARALTGYGYQDNDFIFRQRMHDDGEKVILGQRGKWNGEDFVRILLSQSSCGLFLAYKLYRHFVSDLPDGITPQARTVITNLAGELKRSKGQLAPVLRILFKSQHFYDAAIVGNMIKSPMQLLIGTVRVLNTPVRDIGVLADAANRMGQKLFDPPSVAGWEGGRGWINTSTLFVRQNLAAYLITGKLPSDRSWDASRLEYDPMALIEQLPSKQPEAVVEHLLSTLLGQHVLPERREQLLALVQQQQAAITRDTLIALLLLITAFPEYQLC